MTTKFNPFSWIKVFGLVQTIYRRPLAVKQSKRLLLVGDFVDFIGFEGQVLTFNHIEVAQQAVEYWLRPFSLLEVDNPPTVEIVDMKDADVPAGGFHGWYPCCDFQDFLLRSRDF